MWMLECKDVDECSSVIDYCGRLQCTNTIGSYFCGCTEGFTQVLSECSDVNECKNPNSCPKNANCQNTQGSFACLCHEGFEGADCEDVNECDAGHDCGENTDCINTEGSYECRCKSGFFGNGDTCIKGQCNDAICPQDENRKCVSAHKMDCE